MRQMLVQRQMGQQGLVRGPGLGCVCDHADTRHCVTCSYPPSFNHIHRVILSHSPLPSQTSHSPVSFTLTTPLHRTHNSIKRVDNCLLGNMQRLNVIPKYHKGSCRIIFLLCTVAFTLHACVPEKFLLFC